ncbi:MAG: 5'/3'-nucleotidase SurE [Acholeplasmatales bacterium]|jgi:5'-nucleotidase|nr:5'/3'-nucleotidase SurE [Acholeplasmataceae bacterium]MDY0115282.1 5'/3'-nucleotidase SurE [Acholeplasmatales bacterium]MCK9233843.1 5'/3'-nucleotidase SurE [Acholeplasmataceae bacterium]MCK9289217.1 5'/3'-nucleotidase SurE [Acholeplasmataceae bacterium]MCK9427677.1 5'/3'-nucleotidase SurE [Acholeplasmataceae bacterium]
MKILIVNDDGYQAEGLKILIELLKPLGQLYVLAPKKHHSGMSNAITIRKKIKIKEIFYPGVIKAYRINGYPADCTRMSEVLFKGIKFDLFVSGINEGANIGSNIIHSGTVGAAVEALYLKIPAIAVSSPFLKYSNAKKYTLSIIKTLVANELVSSDYLLNINYPLEDSTPKGIYFAHQGINYSPNEFIIKGNNYYPTYTRRAINEDKNSDVYGYFNNYITIAPLVQERTRTKILNILKENEVKFTL